MPKIKTKVINIIKSPYYDYPLKILEYYNNKGLLIKELEYHNHSSPERTDFEYNDSDKLISSISQNRNGFIGQINKFVYDENQILNYSKINPVFSEVDSYYQLDLYGNYTRMKRVIDFFDNVKSVKTYYEYTYDDFQRLIFVKKIQDRNKRRYTYCKETWFYEGRVSNPFKIVKKYQGDFLKIEIFNKNGKIIKKLEIEAGNKTNEITYKYNEFGDLIEKNTPQDFITYIYTYNEYKHFIECKGFNKSGDLISHCKQDILYWE